MFDLYIYEITTATMQEHRRFAGEFPTLPICEAVGRTAVRKPDPQTAVFQPWRVRFECEARPKHKRIADQALPVRRDWRLVLVLHTDGVETVIRTPELFRTARGCTAAGALARTQHVLDVADGRQPKTTILSYRCEPVTPGIQT